MIMKVMGLEVSAMVPPLPYKPVPAVAGLVTVTVTLPEVAMADAGIATVSWLLLTNVVLAVCAAPFQFTTAFAPKLLPLTVRVNALPPAVALGGLN